MEELSALHVSSMPMPVLIPSAILFTALIVAVLWRMRDLAGGFVVFAIWLRMMTSAFHQYSFDSSPVGLSWNALISIAMALIGLFIVRGHQLLLRILLPIYALIVVVMISGVVNGEYGGLVSVFMKLLLLIVMVLATADAVTRLGDRFLWSVLAAFAPPFVLQILSVLLGVSKATELDGSTSYIGGFFHESPFSMNIMTAVFVVGMIAHMRLSWRAGLLGWCVAALLLADYRTTMIACLPFIAFVAFRAILASTHASQRPLILLGTLCIAFGGVAAVSGDMGSRFADLSAVTKIDDYLTRPPNTFDWGERRLMSGRPYIWSQYVEGWRSGPKHYRIIGAGPEVYPPRMIVYAHNTLVSALFEYGLLGLSVYTWLLIALALPAFRADRRERGRLLFIHLGFIVLNMSTMPLWNIEGVMMYALFVGYTLASVRRGREAAAAAEWQEQQPGRAQPNFV